MRISKRIIIVLTVFLTVFLMSSCTESYTATFYSGELEEQIQVLEAGSKLEVPRFSKENHILSGWYISYNNGDTFDEKWDFEVNTMNSDISLYAKWEKQNYDINFIGLNGEILYTHSNERNEPITGLDLSNIDTSVVGYEFVGWDTVLPDLMPEDDIEVLSVYMINTHTITIVGLLDTIIEEYEFDYNTDLSSVELVDEVFINGYEFLGWDASLPDYMPDEDIIITGEFIEYKRVYNLDSDIGEYEDVFVKDLVLYVSDWFENNLDGEVLITDLESPSSTLSLKPLDMSGERFGTDMDLQGDYLLVGARGANSLVGAAYLYHFTEDGITERTITPSEDENCKLFGSHVDLSGDFIVTSCIPMDPNVSSEKIFVYSIIDEGFEFVIESNHNFAFYGNDYFMTPDGRLLISGSNEKFMQLDIFDLQNPIIRTYEYDTDYYPNGAEIIGDKVVLPLYKNQTDEGVLIILDWYDDEYSRKIEYGEMNTVSYNSYWVDSSSDYIIFPALSENQEHGEIYTFSISDSADAYHIDFDDDRGPLFIEYGALYEEYLIFSINYFDELAKELIILDLITHDMRVIDVVNEYYEVAYDAGYVYLVYQDKVIEYHVGY